MLKRTLCTVLLLFASVVSVFSGEALRSEEPQKVHVNKSFWSWSTLMTQGVNVAAVLADEYTTRKALKASGMYETNPMMRSNIDIPLKIGGIMFSVFMSHQLYKTGHYKMAKLFPFTVATPQFAAAIHNSMVNIGGRK